MRSRTPIEIVNAIHKLHEQGLSVAEVTRRTDVPYSTVFGYVTAKRKGLASYSAYQEDLARRRGSSSLSEYQKKLATRKGFASHTEYKKSLALGGGHASYGAYLDSLYAKRGFASRELYEIDLVERNRQRPETRALSDLIVRRLNEMHKDYSWLAEQLGINEQTIFNYRIRKSFPNRNLLRRLFDALQSGHQTLDDLLK